MRSSSLIFFFFFFNDTATTEIYTLSLHDALPISAEAEHTVLGVEAAAQDVGHQDQHLVAIQVAKAVVDADRKSTRLNSSHSQISYAVFCLKKKKKTKPQHKTTMNNEIDN